MAQVGNSENRFGGQYMIQDRDHMSETTEVSNTAQRGVRQPEQSQSRDRQQGSGDQNASGQQGGERQRNSR